MTELIVELCGLADTETSESLHSAAEPHSALPIFTSAAELSNSNSFLII